MSSTPYAGQLFTCPDPISGTVFINDRVCFQTEGDQRVISVHGVVFSHYSVEDRAAEAYAMVLLFESGYADQNDIARCFGYSARSLRRYQERLKTGGLSALARPEGRPAVSSTVHTKNHARDKTILRLKAKEMSNRWIAGRLGLSETAVRKTLRRLGWQPGPELCLSFLRICYQASVTAVVRRRTGLVTVRTAKWPTVSVHDRGR
jgi:DNA-binding CsgD family transcriptional regulator